MHYQYFYMFPWAKSPYSIIFINEIFIMNSFLEKEYVTIASKIVCKWETGNLEIIGFC